MPRFRRKILGALTVSTLLAHGILLAPAVPLPSLRADLGVLTVLVFAKPLLLYLLAGRVALSFLPPGEVGSHAWLDLPVTIAASLVVGFLLSILLPFETGIHPLWIVLVLALVRWLTLPGAMVPRHRVPLVPFGALDASVVIAAVAWSLYLVLLEERAVAVLWLALLVILFHGLGVARRQRSGRYGVLALGAALCVPPGALRMGTSDGMMPALCLGLGASFSIPWLRRADKRAGLLAALGFGSLFSQGPTLLALAGPGVLVFFSRKNQRRFAGIAVALCSLPFLAAALLAGRTRGARGRLLWLPELVREALDTGVWGLAWPALAVALALGALGFRWRAEAWEPGTIEEPRREVWASCALLALACAALATPTVPWAEMDVLLILFPLCALLAGLLLVPPERVPAPA